MKFKVCAVRRIHGKSAKTGNSYDMPQLVRLVDIEERQSNTYNLVGAGQVTVELPVSNAFFPQLLDIFQNSIGENVFIHLDLELGLDSQNNSLIVGFSESHVNQNEATIHPNQKSEPEPKKPLFQKKST